MDDITQTLEKAIAAAEIITIKYHGGSQPGKERQIAPLSISGGKVRARCYASNAVKFFMVAKIEICESHAPEPAAAWDPRAKPEVRYGSLDELYTQHLSSFTSWGYHISKTDTSLGLHRTWKNGKPLKGPEVAISFHEWTWDKWVDQDEDGELVHIEDNKRKSARPWHVWSKTHSGVSFSKLDKAADRFLLWAEEARPNS